MAVSRNARGFLLEVPSTAQLARCVSGSSYLPLKPWVGTEMGGRTWTWRDQGSYPFWQIPCSALSQPKRSVHVGSLHSFIPVGDRPILMAAAVTGLTSRRAPVLETATLGNVSPEMAG